VFSATNTLSCLAEVFEAAAALDRLEGFTALFGPQFYGLAPNADTITLTKGDPVQFATHIDTGAGPVTLFNPGFDLHWTVTS
jgi:dihydroorotase